MTDNKPLNLRQEFLADIEHFDEFFVLVFDAAVYVSRMPSFIIWILVFLGYPIIKPYHIIRSKIKMKTVYPHIPGLVFEEASPGQNILGTYRGDETDLYVFSPLDEEELYAFVQWVLGLNQMTDGIIDESVMLEIGEMVEDGYGFSDFLSGDIRLQGFSDR